MSQGQPRHLRVNTAWLTTSRGERANSDLKKAGSAQGLYKQHSKPAFARRNTFMNSFWSSSTRMPSRFITIEEPLPTTIQRSVPFLHLLAKSRVGKTLQEIFPVGGRPSGLDHQNPQRVWLIMWILGPHTRTNKSPFLE